jgi:hypothetical protein
MADAAGGSSERSPDDLPVIGQDSEGASRSAFHSSQGIMKLWLIGDYR